MSSELSPVLVVGVAVAGVFLLVATGLTLLWILRTREALARVVGLELLAGLTAGGFVLLGVWERSTFHIEVALLLGLLGFIATIAYARMDRADGGDER